MDDPRIVARIPKSERGEIRVQVGTYKGRVVLDAREWWRDKGGETWRPGYRGLMVGGELVPQIAEALAAAVAAIKDVQATPARTERAEGLENALNAFVPESPGVGSMPAAGDTASGASSVAAPKRQVTAKE